MEILRFLLVSVLLGCSFNAVSSQQHQVSPPASQQNPGLPVNHQQNPGLPVNHQQSLGSSPSSLEQVLVPQIDNTEPTSTTHYPYQSTQLAPSNYYQPHSGNSNYGQNLYSGNRNEGWGWYPYFGVNAGTAWELSAYFGPVFWGLVAVLFTFGACLGVSRFIMGGDLFGGLFQRIKDSTPTGKALDLDNITNIVYQALDTYGKFAAKDARRGSIESMKG